MQQGCGPTKASPSAIVCIAAMSTQIKIERLTDTNYRTWRRMVRAVLVEKELWAVVEKPPQPPPENPANEATALAAKTAFAKAVAEDAKALAVLTIHVSTHLLHLILEDSTVHEAWHALQ